MTESTLNLQKKIIDERIKELISELSITTVGVNHIVDSIVELAFDEPDCVTDGDNLLYFEEEGDLEQFTGGVEYDNDFPEPFRNYPDNYDERTWGTWFDVDYVNSIRGNNYGRHTREYTKVVKEYKEVTTKTHKSVRLPTLSFTLSTKAFMQIMYLMSIYSNIEWGAFFVVNKMPTIEDLEIYFLENYVKGDKEIIEYNIDIEELIVYPQAIGKVEVEYTPDYNHLMKDFIRVKKAGKHLTGIIHSHHTMSAYHSGTDNKFIKERMDEGQKTSSIVVASNHTKVKDLQTYFKDSSFWENYNKAMECFTFHTYTAYPVPTKKHSVGIRFESTVLYVDQPDSEEEFNKILPSIRDFISTYQDMLKEVKELTPYLKFLKTNLKDKKITEPDFYFLKKRVFEVKEAREVFEKLYPFMTKHEEYRAKLNKIVDILKK